MPTNNRHFFRWELRLLTYTARAVILQIITRHTSTDEWTRRVDTCVITAFFLLTFIYIRTSLTVSSIPSGTISTSVIYKVLYIHVRLLLQDTLYTYNPAYHHSATFVPVNVEELKRKEKIAHRQKFVSKKDWVYPEVKTLRHCNEHPKKPDLARCDSLTHVSVLSICMCTWSVLCSYQYRL